MVAEEFGKLFCWYFYKYVTGPYPCGSESCLGLNRLVPLGNSSLCLTVLVFVPIGSKSLMVWSICRLLTEFSAESCLFTLSLVFGSLRTSRSELVKPCLVWAGSVVCLLFKRDSMCLLAAPLICEFDFLNLMSSLKAP